MKIELSHHAFEMLSDISDKRIRTLLGEKIGQLASEPKLMGKPLSKELAGFWSTRSVGQRYRIIYQVDEETSKVLVLAIGIRKEGSKKDIYQLAKKLLRSGLLGK